MARWHSGLDDVLRESYARLGNVHKVASEMGFNHTTIHDHVRLLGIGNKKRYVTQEERAFVIAAYRAAGDGPVNLHDIMTSLDRPQITITRIAKEAGLSRRGRTKSEEERLTSADKARKRIALNGHPRGMLGKRHSEETLAVIGKKSAQAWANFKATGTGNMSPEALQAKSDRMFISAQTRSPENQYSRAKAGRRADLGETYFRSAWEANYARYLNFLQRRGDILSWSYEPKTFWFEKIKRGVRSYKPDFLICEPSGQHFVEVKGYMDSKSITKLRRMKKYYPNVEIRVVAKAEYAEIANKLGSIIPNWE